MEKSSGQEINVVISDMSLYPMSLYAKFTVHNNNIISILALVVLQQGKLLQFVIVLPSVIRYCSGGS